MRNERVSKQNVPHPVAKGRRTVRNCGQAASNGMGTVRKGTPGNRQDPMMVMNKIAVKQRNNAYYFLLDTDVYIGATLLPPNGQYLFDQKTLSEITHSLAVRWGILPAKGKKS